MGFAKPRECELVMACQLRIAAENTKLGQPKINLGIIPGLRQFAMGNTTLSFFEISHPLTKAGRL
jgi:hypothetical protein